ncbi:mitogen-activated protein kinase [Chloropicon primus]|uniref:Mitogen-activated protein kinase n=1 Tax=Chloropicon primus TaxID=1764295 RepID=A0A5B8MXT0_9CHLO|nr:mitogen-activated protein kinase [Chloropicon primus]UPR04563.1 mitogen-activated protein kinase [Chloropicon primus]|eukprot:QDZ25357.1 mitogen-activated protein kinase [Chloropicon primus]
MSMSRSPCRSPTSVDIRHLALLDLEREKQSLSRSWTRKASASGNSPGSLAPIERRGRASVLGPDRVTPRTDPHVLRKIASAPDSQHYPQRYFRDTVKSPGGRGSPFSSPTKVRAHRRTFDIGASASAASSGGGQGARYPWYPYPPGSRSPSPGGSYAPGALDHKGNGNGAAGSSGPRTAKVGRVLGLGPRKKDGLGQEEAKVDHLARDLLYTIKGKRKGTIRELLEEQGLGPKEEWNVLLDAITLPSGRTPLQEAVFYDQGERAKELLDVGVDADLDPLRGAGQHHQGSPLIIACKLGHHEVADLLITYGASVHCVDQDAFTPLHHACAEGHARCAEVVLSQGASIRARTKGGLTPLQLASTDGVRDLFNPSSRSRKAEEEDGGVPERPRGRDSNSMFRESSKRIESGEMEWKKGELLGEGAYGRVYAGLNHETGQIMAVKQIAVDMDNDKHTDNLKALEREIEFYKTLKHEHIVEYYGAFLDKDQHLMYVFLEYVSGGSISSMLKRFGPFSEALTKIYTKQILRGLLFLHENKTIHRDVKGANILITQEGSAKLADFGASKRYVNAENSGSGLSNSKSITGSVYWMAPEVMKGTGHGRKADIWSLGCTVVEMLTGKHPWKEYDNTWTAMFQIAKSESGPGLPKNISKDAREFLQLCFQLDPTKRPTALDLLGTQFCGEQDARS